MVLSSKEGEREKKETYKEKLWPERGGSGGLENMRDECEGGVKEE